ncbi:MAG: hypothetical protein HKP30_18725 [Myxococcales bacterium]|nr:hypothetical protein [Myxococcales bacterium]
MLVFALTLVVLCLAAAGLAVGAVRGRPLPGGSCREAWLAGHQLPRCAACPSREPALRRASPR